MGRISEARRRLVSQVRGLRPGQWSAGPGLRTERTEVSGRVPPRAASSVDPYECGVCGRRLLTGEQRGCFCIEGRRVVACSLCDIDLAAAGFARANEDDGARGGPDELADCA